MKACVLNKKKRKRFIKHWKFLDIKMFLTYYLKNTYDFIYETFISEFIMILMIKRMLNVPMYIGFS